MNTVTSTKPINADSDRLPWIVRIIRIVPNETSMQRRQKIRSAGHRVSNIGTSRTGGGCHLRAHTSTDSSE